MKCIHSGAAQRPFHRYVHYFKKIACTDCSLVIKVKTAEQTNKQQIYDKSFEVLEPEIKRLRDFMYFQRDTIKVASTWV